MYMEQIESASIGILDTISNALGNPGITLGPSELHFLTSVVNNSPGLFNIIDNEIQLIISDGKIDLHDIPQIIFVIVQVFKGIRGHQSINLLIVVQFILDVILDSGLLPIPAVEITVIKRVIDFSLGLLNTNINKVENFVKREVEICKKKQCCTIN